MVKELVWGSLQMGSRDPVGLGCVGRAAPFGAVALFSSWVSLTRGGLPPAGWGKILKVPLRVIETVGGGSSLAVGSRPSPLFGSPP